MLGVFRLGGMLLVWNCCIGTTYGQVVVRDSVVQPLQEIVIVSKKPVAEKFSSIQLGKMDVYFNPASSGDPLKALTILPLSTNTTESANPVLRGGRADQSQVYLNGVPIVNPVRNTTASGLGNFSIFNTELLDQELVFASNPPLTYGNSSAGIVAIETTNELERDSYQVAVALSSVGVQVNKKIGARDFVQLYLNDQFSEVLQAVNKGSLSDLNGFHSQDAGLHVRVNLTPSLVWTSYSYAVAEYSDSKQYSLIYRSDAKANQTRFFTVNSLAYSRPRSLFKLSSLMDESRTSYRFQTIDSQVRNTQYFISLSHKYRAGYSWNLQYGIDVSQVRYAYNEVKPSAYYAMEERHPTIESVAKQRLPAASFYLFSDYKWSNSFGFAVGVRQHVGIDDKRFSYGSRQLSAWYTVNANHRFVFGLGQYNSYTTPNYYNQAIQVVHSKQLALDYYYERGNTEVTGAIYVKRDKGEQQISTVERVSDQHIVGVEGAYKKDFNRLVSVYASTSLLRRAQDINGVLQRKWMFFLKDN